MTITGLPLHPLVIHAVVVLLPLMALFTILVAVRRGLRDKYALWVFAGNVVMIGLTFLAKYSGQALQASLGGQVAIEHGRLGSLMPLWAIVMAVTSGAVWYWRDNKTIGHVAGILSILAAVVAVVWTVRTGDSGARAVWGRG